jgi:hydroxyethylthiazole kinase-like uncharacterized protein yjeF
MSSLYSVAEIRAIEQAALAALPSFTLMQRAGQAAAKLALELVAAPHGDAKVLILAGPGNNGGDAYEAAFRLEEAGLQVTVLHHTDPAKRSDDARQALQRAQSTPARFIDFSSLATISATHWSLVIDGIFGIGLQRPIGDPWAEVVTLVNGMRCPVLALDVPSGLDADTGNLVGPDGIAVRASHTVTFIGDKPGLHTCDGRDYAGAVQVARLDIERKHFTAPHIHLNQVQHFADALKPRLHNSHKGSYGDVAVLGGAAGMCGAPILAGRAAALSGAGRVIVVFLDQAPPYDSTQPELMLRAARDVEMRGAALVAGPGLGTSRAAHDLLARALNADAPLVADADALNLIAQEPALQRKLAARKAPSILTPHPLEAARLLDSSSKAVQADRLAAARELARRFDASVVLKGSGTVLARPNGRAAINTTGNPALATGGSGDVLAGICGALLAQGWQEWLAALGAVWLHGHAADMLVRRGIGPIGVTASELLPEVRSGLNRLVAEHA